MFSPSVSSVGVSVAVAAAVVTARSSRRQMVISAGLCGVDRATAEATSTVAAARTARARRRTILVVAKYFVSRFLVEQGSVT